METNNIFAPSACYIVEKILEISQGQGTLRSLKVQWAPSWVSEVHLLGCEALINQFLNQKSYDDTASQNNSEEVKLEDDGSINQNEVECASDNIDISLQQGNDIEDETQIVARDTNVLCDTIKIEEDDISTEPTSNEELTLHQDTTIESIEPSNDNDNENYHFDRCIGDVPVNLSAASGNQNWSQNSHDSPKQMNPNVSLYMNYSGSNTGNQDNTSSARQRKQINIHNVNSTSTNVTSTGRLLQREKEYSNKTVNSNHSKNNGIDLATHPRQILHTNVENNVKLSQDYISTVLQHPSKQLSNSSKTDVSLQQRKLTLVDTNDDNTSTYTKFPKTFLVGSDEDNPVNNEAIETTGYKNASAFMNYSTNASGPTDTAPGSENTNSNERDDNRHSEISTGVNVLGNFETSVVSQYEDKSADEGPSVVLALDPYSHVKTTNFHTQEKSGPHDIEIQAVPLAITQHTNERNASGSGFGQSIGKEPAHRTEVEYMGSNPTVITLKNTMPRFGLPNIDSNNKCNCDNCIKIIGKKTYVDVPFLFCNFCTKKFRCYTLWKQHERVHTEEFPYQCRYCLKKFKQVSNLNTHIRRRHTNEKPHNCSLCSKRFSTTSDLKSHLRVHDERRPYECSVCLKKFKFRSAMKQHMRRCSTIKLSAM